MPVSYTPLTSNGESFCKTLGHLMILWNSAEASVRLLLFGVMNPRRPGFETDILISHLANVAIIESLTAVADCFEDPMRSHLKHCAKLFDSNRIYRNHFAHAPLILGWREDGTTVALTQTTTAKGGALRRSDGEIVEADMEKFIEQLDAFKKYVSDLISAVWEIPDHTPLASLQMPPLPNKLERRYRNLVELARQQQSSQA